ncbi:MAG: cation:proton antiporter, partial [Acidimicrobiales bacterium]
AAAEAVGGSGFLAAAAAGLTIAVTDADLCDCFLDFGQAAAELFLLFTFVALGSSLIWTGFEVVSWRVLAFAGVALAARSVVLAVALTPLRLDRASRRLIVGFGPRGLSTRLLVLLPVFAGTPGAQQLFAIAALVVLFSVILHGGALALLPGQSAPAGPGRPAVVEAPRSAPSAERITLDELRALLAGPDTVRLVDVRTERTYRHSPTQARGAIRLPPDAPAERAAELALPRNDWLVAYCT